MANSNKKELLVPTFTETEAEDIKQGLLDSNEEVRALTITTVFGRVLKPIPRTIKVSIKDAASWQRAFGHAFDAIGGVDRLAEWGDENFADFVKQMGHTFAATANLTLGATGNVYINTPVPKSELDDPDYIDADVSEIDGDDTL